MWYDPYNNNSSSEDEDDFRDDSSDAQFLYEITQEALYQPYTSHNFLPVASREDTALKHESEFSDPEILHVRNDIFSCISDVHRESTVSGNIPSFAYTEHLDALPNPGLHISGIGLISFPLTRRDKTDILASPLCSASPFGMGEATVVDDNVRKCVQIDHQHFEFKNPKFYEWFKNAVNVARDRLGIVGEVEAQPYKLLLYQEGSSFKAHRDSEKTPGMMGTVVLCLPSKHEGGTVVLSHDGQQRKFDSSPTSEYGYSFAAWYTGITHEVLTVTSGCRMAVTFNLVAISHASSNLKDWANKRDMFNSFINKWDGLLASQLKNYQYLLKEDALMRKLVFVLSHEYSMASLKQSGVLALKGKDRTLGDFLCQSSDRETSFGVYIAYIEKHKILDYDDVRMHHPRLWDWAFDISERNRPHEIQRIDESKVTVKCVIDLRTGANLGELDHLGIPRRELLGSDLFGFKPDKWKESGFAGNEGATAKHWHKKTALIIVPQSCISIFFGGFNQPKAAADAVNTLLKQSAEIYINSQRSENDKQLLMEICMEVIRNSSWSIGATSKDKLRLSHDSEHPVFLAECAVLMDDTAILAQMFEKSSEKTGFFKFLADAEIVQLAIGKFGFQKARSTFLNFEVDMNLGDKRSIAIFEKFCHEFVSSLRDAFKEYSFRCLSTLSNDTPEGASECRKMKIPFLRQQELQDLLDWLNHCFLPQINTQLKLLFTLDNSYTNRRECLGEEYMGLIQTFHLAPKVISLLKEWKDSLRRIVITVKSYERAQNISLTQEEWEDMRTILHESLDNNLLKDQETFIKAIFKKEGPRLGNYTIDTGKERVHLKGDEIAHIILTLEKQQDEARLNKLISLLSCMLNTVIVDEARNPPSWKTQEKSYPLVKRSGDDFMYREALDLEQIILFLFSLFKALLPKTASPSLYSELCKNSIWGYLTSYLGAMERPPPPKPALIPPSSIVPCRDSCAECSALNEFLGKDTLLGSRERFPVDERKAEHIEAMLREFSTKSPPSITIEMVERQGGLFLDLEKPYIKIHHKWQMLMDRFKQARTTIMGFADEALLTRVVGEPFCRAIMAYIDPHNPVAPELPSQDHQEPLPGRAPASVATNVGGEEA